MSNIKVWKNKAFAKNLIKDALESLHATCVFLLKPNTTNEVNQLDPTNESNQPNANRIGDDDFFAALVQDDPEVTTSTNQVLLHQFEDELKSEISNFMEILLNRNILAKIISNKKFWLDYRKNLPKLFKVATILLNKCFCRAFF